MNCLSVGSVTLTLLAFACSMAATFSPAWVSVNGLLIGFFGTCGSAICISGGLLEISAGTRASSAFMIIGTIVLLVGCIFVGKGVKQSQTNSIKGGGITSILGGIAVMIGAAVFAGTVPAIGFSYSACFGLAWVAFVLGIAGGVMSIQLSNQ